MIWERRGLVRGFSSAAPVSVNTGPRNGSRRPRACVKLKRNSSSLRAAGAAAPLGTALP